MTPLKQLVIAAILATTVWHGCIVAVVYYLDLGTKHQRRHQEFEYDP